MYDGGIYAECMTAPVTKPFFRFLQYLFCILGAVCLVGAVISFFAVIPAIALWLLGWFFGSRSSVEYEYSLLGRELTVDAVFNKSSRKTAGIYDLDKAQGIYPEGASRLMAYEGRNLKKTDYSEGKDAPGNHVIVMEGDELILFTPDEEFLAALRKSVKDKVFGA